EGVQKPSIDGSSPQPIAQPIECAGGLAFGHASDQRPADERPQGAERWMKLVAIIKPRAAALAEQRIICPRARACRSATLPYGELAGIALDQGPVNVEADTAHVYVLVHPKTNARRTRVGVSQPTVDRDPIAQPG